MGLLDAFKNFAIVTELIYGSAFTAPTLFNLPKEAEAAPLYDAPMTHGPQVKHKGMGNPAAKGGCCAPFQVRSPG